MRWYFQFSLLVAFSTPIFAAAQQEDIYRSQVDPKANSGSTFFDESKVVQAAYFQDEEDTDKTKEDEHAALEEEKSEAKEKRDDVAEQIRVAERQVKKEQSENGESKGASPGEANSADERRLRLLKNLDVILAQRAQQTATLVDAKKELDDRVQEHQNVQHGKLGVDKPYSFLLLVQLQDELATLKSSFTSNQSNQTIVNEDIVQAKQSLEEKEKAYRLAKEAVELLVKCFQSAGSHATGE